MKVAALRFQVNNEYSADIYPVGSYNNIDWDSVQPCPLGDGFSAFASISPNTDPGLLRIDVGLDGTNILRLTETKRYIIRINTSKDKIPCLPSLPNESNQFLRLDRDKNTLTFQFINYLGRSRFYFSDHDEKRVFPFEVVPDKMDYEDDYIELTEALAERCAELLLDYSGSTSSIFSMADTDSKTLLEQFIFMRQFCFTENMLSLFESIKRNPDRVLVEDEEIRPLGYGKPSKKVYTQPFRYSRNWTSYTTAETGRKKCLPSEIVVSHKKDNHDTPANRFLKYALEQFHTLCVALINALNDNKAPSQTECLKEAELIQNMTEDILYDAFFDDVGILDIMPQNNQVLQKREGYSQIFAAYTMLDLALQLDWKGKDSVYEGEAKNVALLYEYWLFFELGRVIKSIDGCSVEKVQEYPFVSADNGKLTISLREGVQSCQSFHIASLGIIINLYYNRSFSPAEFRTTKYEGSYSRLFRPDYTLAIFPDRYNSGKYNGEAAAIHDGAVSYIHFDAKYRITDLTALVGKASETADEEKLELEEEKAGEVINTYKRGDLLKMHTYNDAIRRTIGSYVLYPGNGNTDDQKHVFSLYDEILPGVGAFAIKPSISALGEAELKHFITGLIRENAKNSSRLNRLKYYSEMILQEPPSADIVPEDRITRMNADQREVGLSRDLCVIGYMRSDTPEDYYPFLRKAGYLKKGKEFYFYYYAIKNGAVYSHHQDIFKSGRFRIYTNAVRETNTYRLEPVICSIERNELLAKADLVRRLSSLGYMTTEEQHSADYYYVIKLKVIEDAAECVSLAVAEVDSINGNDSVSTHSPKVLPFMAVIN